MLTVPGGLEYESTTELVRALAARRISARELLEQTLARIEYFNPAINAVVVRDYERARAAAAAADAALARGERRALLGVPMTVKESYNVAGLPMTWGIPMFADWRSNEDAAAVARLKSAGAIIVGKSNVPFALSDWQSYNDVYGTTNNPWDFARSPGGSSGGSAAAVAAGLVSLELGSDIAGSLRAPAHFCGVCAHKPSYGIVPLRGHTWPRSEALDAHGDGYLAVGGPLARTAADLALAIDVLAGPDEEDAVGYALRLPPARHNDLKSYRVLVLDTHPLLPTASPVRAALNRLADRLVQSGVRVARESALVPDLAEGARIYTRLLFAFMSSARTPQFDLETQAVVTSLPAADDSLAAWRLRGAVLSHRDWIAANEARSALRLRWSELFGEWDVVLCPPMSTPAFPHDHGLNREARRIEIDGLLFPYEDQIVWPSVATLPGLPATVTPIDPLNSRLPIGVQIIGPYLEDRTPLAFAALIELEYGGFTPPPGYTLSEEATL
jgi:amidase